MWPLAMASMFPWPAPNKLRHNSSAEEDSPLQPLTSYNVWGDSDLGKVYCSHAALYRWAYQSGMSHFLWNIFRLDIKFKTVLDALLFIQKVRFRSRQKRVWTAYCLPWHFMTNQYINCQTAALGHFLRDCLLPVGCVARGQWGHFGVPDPAYLGWFRVDWDRGHWEAINGGGHPVDRSTDNQRDGTGLTRHI